MTSEANNSRGKEHVVQMIPLMRFRAARNITLGECKIRKLNSIEKQKIRSSASLDLAWPEAVKHTFDYIDFVIEYMLKDTSLARDVISALRVFKSEAVSALSYINLSICDKEIEHVDACQWWTPFYETTDASPYTLTGEEARKFEEFWISFSGSMGFPYMRTAIDRFSHAYQGGFIGDQLVDYIIALEALFSESSEAIGYKLRFRVPIFLASDVSISERRRIKDYVATAYNVRSIIVHGSQKYEKLIQKEMRKLGRKLGLDEMNFVTQFLPEIREITRRAIYRFVTPPGRRRNKVSLLQDIDDALLKLDREEIN